MFGYSLWEYDLQESIKDFTERPFSVDSAEELLEGLGFGEVSITSGPASVDKLLFVYSHTDYAFTSDDLSWIAVAREVITATCENGLCFYLIEVLCDEEEYYYYCAAIVKIFNVVFPGKNVYVFKIGSSFAIGAPRSFVKLSDNSFCVSGLVSANNLSDRQEFLSEFQYADPLEVPEIVIRYSPQEVYEESRKSKGIQEIDPDYLRFLDEVKSFYGEDTDEERRRYLSAHEGKNTEPGNYRDACKVLANTAETDNISSYEELEKAEIAEKRASNVTLRERTLSFDQNETVLSNPAIPDAEEMLKEILERRF